jgi:phosphocarrier protein HPr
LYLGCEKMGFSKTIAQAIVELNRTAQQFRSSIVIKTENITVDAKSILGLSNSILVSNSFLLEIHGPDEEEAKKEMAAIFCKYQLPVKILNK